MAEGSVIFTCSMVKNPSIKGSITVTVTQEQQATKTNTISPVTTEMSARDTVNYTVYAYANGVQQSDTFSITASGVNASYYTLTTSENGFSINCLNGSDYPLLITCSNNVDGSSVSISVTLSGW